MNADEVTGEIAHGWLVLLGVGPDDTQKAVTWLADKVANLRAFEDADGFDVGRDPNPHVGFGMGLHFCLGAPLARLELQISLRTLLARFGTIEVQAAPRRPTWVLRGYESLVCDLSVTA